MRRGPKRLPREITEMQARAIFEAVVQVARKGVHVIPEVMIPLTGSVKELGHQREIVVKVATEAEFFSYGTNDLTQTVMGLSRDAYVKFSKIYEDLKIFKADPFAVLDQEGVGKLVEMGVKLGRETRPDLEIGICGEPSSVEFCYQVGMNYVSCPPTVCRSRAWLRRKRRSRATRPRPCARRSAGPSHSIPRGAEAAKVSAPLALEWV